MDGEIFFLLVPLAIVVGWVLGIRGYVLAKRAGAEIARLRAALAAAASAAPAAAPAAAPPPLPAPEPASAPAPSPWAEAPPPAAGQSAAPEDHAPPRPAPPPPAPKPARNIEELLTARWGVWLGAGALLLAVVFLIRFAVEEDYRPWHVQRRFSREARGLPPFTR